MDVGVWPAIIACMKGLDPDPDHALHVCRLSIILFNLLYTLLPIELEDYNYLKAAALLHDIGWSNPEKPHHKSSRDLILSDNTIPFSEKERIITALIARYHRKSVPVPDHAIYRDLTSRSKEIVNSCSALLRIADALDRSHRQCVRDVECTIAESEIVIIANCDSPLDSEYSVFAEKSTLLEDITCRSVSLRWILNSPE